MFIGYIVGIIVAKKNYEKRMWPMWMILAGTIALASAAVNSAVFGNRLF